MQYAIAFLEGIITFISPCLLPMLPIYVSYFAGGGERSTGKTLKIAAGFVLGFTVVFTALGALAGTAGGFLREHRTAVNLISGLVVIVFGLNFLGVFRLNLFRGGGASMNTRELGFFSAVLFGMIFSLGWTPCVGAFLGSALMLASQQGSRHDPQSPQALQMCGKRSSPSPPSRRPASPAAKPGGQKYKSAHSTQSAPGSRFVWAYYLRTYSSY